MGFTAIVNISEGRYTRAAVFILVAGIFDMLDGVMARLTKSTSEFGVELDSLCDAVSFGVAPSYMLYSVFFFKYNDIGILFASLPALAGVVRLARFNVQLSSFEDKKYFKGLPIPSGALTIISYIIFFHLTNAMPEDWKPATIFVVTIVTALAMVSRIKYDNLPRPTKRSFSQKPVIFVIFILGIIITIATKGVGLFPFMLFYLFASAIRHFIAWVKEVREASDDIDESVTAGSD
jgi:CDP-diacylglycerol--serine O-phosphatidyltransferase